MCGLARPRKVQEVRLGVGYLLGAPLLGRLIAVLIGLQLQVTLVEIDHPLLGGPAGSLLGGRDLPVRVGVVHLDRRLLFGGFNGCSGSLVQRCRARLISHGVRTMRVGDRRYSNLESLF